MCFFVRDEENLYQILTLHGLSMYSSGDEERTEPGFCASGLLARTFAPHDELAKFFRRLPFLTEFGGIDAPCGLFVEPVDDASSETVS